MYGIRRNCLRNGRSWLFYLSVRRVIKQTAVIIKAHHFCHLPTKFYQHPAVKINYICRRNYWGSSVWIWTQQVNYWSYILRSWHTWEKMGIKWSSASAIYRIRNLTIQLGGKSVIIFSLIFVSPWNWGYKMCLKGTYSRVRVGKHLSDTFPIKNSLKQGDALSPLLFKLCS